MASESEYGYLLAGLYLAINVVSFFIMWWDKVSSRQRNVPRISEGMMFFLGVLFGSVGILAGMFTFRHKTHKWYFLLGMPLLILQNSALLFVLSLLLEGDVRMSF